MGDGTAAAEAVAGLPTKSETSEAGQKPDKGDQETAQAVIELAQELNEDVGPLSAELSFVTQESLAVIATGGDRFKAYETRGEQIVADAKNPETNLTDEQRQTRTALGLDMQIDGLNMQSQELAAKAQKASGKKKEEIGRSLSELTAKINKVTKEREKIKLPNQLSEFAQLFGISAEEASKFPLAQVEAYINEAINNGKFRQELIANLKTNNQLQSDEAKQMVANFEIYLNAQGRKKTVEKGAKVVGKIGLGALLMSLMMMWLSSKEKKQGAIG